MPASSPTAPAAGEPTFDRRYTIVVMLILAGIVMTVLYVEGMLIPSLPIIQKQFHVDAAQASLIVSSYAVSGVALSPVIGKLGDIYGKRRMLIVTMAAYAVSVSVTGFSPTFLFMVAARTVQGIGLTILPLGMALVREEFPRDFVPKAQGILSAMFGIGFAISLPVGSWVSYSFGWRVTYHSSIPVVASLALLVFFFVRESRYTRPNVRVDYVGAAFLGGALAAIVTALSEGESWGWVSPLTLGLVAVGALLFVPFLLYERRWKHAGREPVMDQKLLANRNVAVTNAVLTVAGLGMYLALFALIYRFEFPPISGGFSQTILQAGLDIVPLAIAMIVFGPLASILVSRVGVKPLALFGGTLTAIGFGVMAYAHTLEQALLFEGVIGAGLGFLNASIINLLVLTVDPRDMGQATAMNNVFRNLGGSVGAPIAGSLLSTYILTVAPGLSVPAPVAFQYAFLIAAAITFVGSLVTVAGEEVLGPRAARGARRLPTDGSSDRPSGAVPARGSP